MNITASSSMIYNLNLLKTILFFILINMLGVSHVLAETDSNIIPELATDADDGNTPVWNGYQPQPATTPSNVNNNNASNTEKEGYAKPIATIVPSAKSIIQGEIIYFRLEYENAGASYYWIMEDQRGSERSLRVDTSTLKPGKYRVRVSVTNKARQQANSQVFFKVLAKTGSDSNSETTSDTKANGTTETPVDPEPVNYQVSNEEKTSPAEKTNTITIQPTMLSLDQGQVASFRSSEQLSSNYQFNWRFGTQLSDLDKFQISTQDVIPGTYKVYLRVTDKEGQNKNLTAQLIVRDPDTEKTKVPDFVGKNIESIEDELKTAQLVSGKIEKKEVTEKQGEIITQFPASGTEVNVNGKIDLVVGIGADIEVPDVIGKDIQDAKTLLEERAIKVNIEKKIADEEEGIILSQSPEAGGNLKQGDTIKLVVAEKAVVSEPLDIAINTETPSVEQGTDAVFNAVVKNNVAGEDYLYTWQLGTQKSTGSQLTINTDELALGQHTVTLQIKQKGKEDRQAASEAVFEISAKRLLVPNLKGLSLEDAQKALEKVNMTLGTVKQQEGKVETAVIKQQSPAFGEYVNADQRIDLVLLIPEKEKTKPTQVAISFDKTTGKAGEPIVFTTQVTSDANLKDVHYIYSINNVKKASVEERFTWIPEEKGAYTVSVTAYDDSGIVAKSEPYTLDIDTGWEKPIAKLLPKKIEVKQGDNIDFVSNSTYDLNSKLAYEWTSSSGHGGSKKVFSIDTAEINAGRYNVTLKVTDDKGNQSTTVAYFIIQEVLDGDTSTTDNTINIDNKTNKEDANANETSVVQFSADGKGKQKPNVALQTSRRIAQIGQKIQFNMQVSPATNVETLYYYQLGDKKRRQWMKTSAFEHQYNSFGSYSVRAVIKQNGEVYYSDSVTIWVWSPWLLGIIGGLTFFLFILIVWWTRRTSDDLNRPYYGGEYNRNNEEHIPLLKADEINETNQTSGEILIAVEEKKSDANKNDIVTEKREQDSVKSVLLRGIIQFILGILLSFIILYMILKFMGLV